MMRASGAVRAAGVMLAALCLGAAAPTRAATAAAPQAALADPNVIFANVRKAWGEGAYPRWAQYATVVEFHKNGRLVRRTWDTTEDLRHGVVYSRKFSREDMMNPKVPHGINVVVPILGNLNKEPVPDPIGHVAFAVDQDDGMAPGARRLTLATSDKAFDAVASQLPVIGHSGTVERDYDVTLIETLADEQGPEYHLGLQPLRDPDHHRLRELYVDGRTWAPEEAVVAGIGSRPPLTKVQWRIEYHQVEGATYIARETALNDLDFGSNGSLKWATISFRELQVGSQRPFISMFGLDDDGPQTEP